MRRKPSRAAASGRVSRSLTPSSDPLGRRWIGLALAVVPALLLALFLVIPLGLLVLWSLQPPGIGTGLTLPLGLDTYTLNLSTPEDWYLLAKTVFMTLIVAVASVALSYPIAYFLALIASGRRKYILLVLALLPFLTGYLLRIFAWRLLLGTSGLINFALEGVGLIHEPLQFLLFTRTAVILVLIYVWVPWAALPIFVRLEQMDRSLLWAAADLGASPIRAFARVTFPLSLTGVFVAFFFVFIPTLGDFATAGLVGGTDGVMVGNIIQGFLTSLVYPSGAALSVLLLLVALAAMIVGARLVRFEEWIGRATNV
jgi:spermidine/putrescine transport system permease protein